MGLSKKTAFFLFFLAAFVFVSPFSVIAGTNPALYPSHKYFSGGTSDCALTTGDWTGTISSAEITSVNYIAEIILQQGSSGRVYYMDLYNDGGGPILASATSTSLGGGKYAFTFPEHSHLNQTYDFVLRNGGYNTAWQRWTSTVNDPDIHFITGCTNGSTPNSVVFLASTTEQTGGGGGATVMISDIMGDMTTQWSCTDTATGTVCNATATTSVSLYDGPNFQEWLFVAGVILFFLSFISWGKISWTKQKV